MMHHMMGFFLLNCLWFFFSRYSSLFSSFNVSQFLSNIYYAYLPKKISQFRFLYVVFGVGFSLIFQFFTQKFIAFLKKIKDLGLFKVKKLLK